MTLLKFMVIDFSNNEYTEEGVGEGGRIHPTLAILDSKKPDLLRINNYDFRKCKS